MRYLLTTELIDKWFVRSKRGAKFFSTKMLSVSLCNSVQVRHLYRKLLHRNRRSSKRKSRIKSPCVWLKYLIWIWFLWKEDQIYTRHCSKQTLTTLKNLNYLLILTKKKKNGTSFTRTVTTIFSSKTVNYLTESIIHSHRRLNNGSCTKIYLDSVSKWQGK